MLVLCTFSRRFESGAEDRQDGAEGPHRVNPRNLRPFWKVWYLRHKLTFGILPALVHDRLADIGLERAHIGVGLVDEIAQLRLGERNVTVIIERLPVLLRVPEGPQSPEVRPHRFSRTPVLRPPRFRADDQARIQLSFGTRVHWTCVNLLCHRDLLGSQAIRGVTLDALQGCDIEPFGCASSRILYDAVRHAIEAVTRGDCGQCDERRFRGRQVDLSVRAAGRTVRQETSAPHRRGRGHIHVDGGGNSAR